MGLSAWPFSRYSRCRPSSRTSTAPTSRRTRRCLDTCGWASPSTRTMSFTGRSPPARTSRICRRRGSATALNASAVVAARAMGKSYTHIGMYQVELRPLLITCRRLRFRRQVVERQSVRLVETAVLEIEVEEEGPPDGRPVLLLHGWPDAPRGWRPVAKRLHESGWRTVVPALRGCGETRFRSA